jgi:hypothetical protein
MVFDGWMMVHGAGLGLARAFAARRYCLAVWLVFLAAPSVRAETIFLGPTPYRSAADSPFDLSGLGETFFLEDFEDGGLNTPGITSLPVEGPFPPILAGTVRGPGDMTDSVDADDGRIDGLGADGHSFQSNGIVIATSDPPINDRLIRFEFGSAPLGGFPTTFGFVWTDGPPGVMAIMDFLDANGKQHRHLYEESLGDESRAGTTADDRFFGVLSTTGISRVDIRIVSVGNEIGPQFAEIDHVQYGMNFVPEPSTTTIAALVATLALFRPAWPTIRRTAQRAAPI